MAFGGALFERNSVEQKLRRFRAAFYITPLFANWVRARAHELAAEGRAFEIVMCWGGMRFRVGELPAEDPYFAIEHADGSVERSRWCPP